MRAALFVAAILVITVLGGCTAETGESEAPGTAPTPVEHSRGEALFKTHCASCHGDRGQGTDRGPTFLHRMYRPGHHGDQSFHLAVQRGAKAHHWRFGNMPRIEGLDANDVDEIIGYVRWLQRQAGIY